MSAWNISQWCSPWVPDHAYIDGDDDYTTWSATWSTPDSIVSIEYGGQQVLIVTAMWVEVKLRYPQRDRLVAVLDALLPRCRELTPAERAEIASPPMVEQTVSEAEPEHHEVGGYADGGERGIRCACGIWVEGLAREVREAFDHHVAEAASTTVGA